MNETLIVLGNEVRKGLRFAWAERLQILIELPMFAAFILLLGPLLGQGGHIAQGTVDWSLNSARTSMMVVWFVPFVFFYMQVVKMFWRLVGEIQAGTIEQVYLSPLPSWVVAAAGRVVAALTETVLVAAATYGIVSLFVPIHVSWHPAALLPAGMLVIAAVGLSLVIAGATLVWKRIELVNDLVLAMVMMFSASALPLIDAPAWWTDLGHVFPLTDPVGGLYRTLLTDHTGLAVWGTGGIAPLLIIPVAYLLSGVLAFRAGERLAKRRGTLGRY